MFTTLLKIAVFVLVIVGLTWGALWITSLDGGAVVSFAGSEISLSALQLVAAVLALMALGWLAMKILKLLVATYHFLNGDETAISRHFDRNRTRKGHDALAEGYFALAAGEGHLAMQKAKRAEKYLNRPDLTTLMKAQAAEMTGDTRTSEESYRALLSKDETRFVGVRGLMQQKLEEGDRDTALGLARKAFELKPMHKGTQDTLLRLQAEKEDWKGARETLEAKLKAGHMPRELHRRRDAVLALSEAREIMDEGADMKAREAAIEANRLSPDLVPAAVMAARAHIAKGEPRKASRILSKTWGVTPHPDIAAAFAEIAPKETPKERLKRFTTLTKQNPDHPETRMLLAELHIAAEDFPQAKRDLGHLVTDDPTARTLTLMAAIERGEGSDDAVVRGWLTRAVTAPRGPQWICDNCQHIHAHWAPVCENCSAFDTLAWKRPPAAEVAMPTGTEMLPLIVGQKPAVGQQGREIEVVEAEPIVSDTTTQN